jgi:hypothetical protein
MTKIVVILGQNGEYESVFSNDEIILEVLKRGENDSQIDKAENNMEQVNEC